MARYRKYDNACRRKQFERWVKRICQDRTSSVERFNVLGKRGPHVGTTGRLLDTILTLYAQLGTNDFIS